MKSLLMVLAMAGLMGVQAQRLSDVPPQDQVAIRQVIEAQIAAFKKDDALAAYSFASPGIQRIFPNADVFVEMVKSGYAQIYRPLKVEFDKISRINAGVLQVVKITGADGIRILAYYLMEKQPDGQWKIAGVQIEGDDSDTTT